MLRNYFKLALRNLLRNKGFSAINIFGLAIGMASTILILLWIENELSHDRFHTKGNRIYTMYNRDEFSGGMHAWSTTSQPLAQALKMEFPQVEDAVRFVDNSFVVTTGEKHLNVRGSITDSGFLNVFSFPLLQGSLSNGLSATNNVVITQKLSEKLFGKEDAMGKSIRLDNKDNFIVTGIIKDLPNNTLFDFELLVTWNYLIKRGWSDSSWSNNSVKTYTLLKLNTTQATFDKLVKNVIINHTKNDEKSTTEVFSQPIGDAWLYARSENGELVAGRIEVVKMFGIVAMSILLIACINFMNLSTARSEKRAKEAGIRKVLGAQKKSLIFQFIGESVMLAFISGILSLAIVQLSLPGFNSLVDKQLFIDYSRPFYWLFMAGFILFCGILAGSYPAFYLYASKPVTTLKGTFRTASTLIAPRKVLVVFQFTIAIILIISTIIVRRQTSYAQQREEGYSQDALIYTWFHGDMEKHFNLIKQELLNSGAAVAITKSMGPITQSNSDGWGFTWQGSTKQDEKTDFHMMSTDADFTKTMGIKLVAGRDIDVNAFATDSTAMLVNETAVKTMRLKNPIGQLITDGDRSWHIVGVIKDFIFESPYQPVAPTFIKGPAANFNAMHIRLNPARGIADNLKRVEKVFSVYNAGYPFDYTFADADYALKFNSEVRTSRFAALFAFLTIFISCLGLFGLAICMAENRIKEVGIRKVLGASVFNITALLSKDFLKLVLIAFVVASPISWFAMNKWLQGYHYRVAVSWWVFATAGLLSVVIAIATVSYQAVKAAMANPVKNLRSE